MAFESVGAMARQQNEASAAASQKQENAFTKQIDQLSVNASQVTKAFDDKLDDLKKTLDDKFTDIKDRIVAMESRSSVMRSDNCGGVARHGADDRRLETIQRPGLGRLSAAHNSTAWIFSAIAAAVAIAVMAMEMFRSRPLNLVEELARASASLRKRWRQEKMP